jgi:hypothetical protein
VVAQRPGDAFRGGNQWQRLVRDRPDLRAARIVVLELHVISKQIIAASASGDLAYIVALEHTTASVKGAPAQPYVLRVTTVFRREDGEWKVVHRHGDPASRSATVMAEQLAPTLAK